MSFAKSTKLELIKLLTDANKEREALRVTVAEQAATIAMLKRGATHGPRPSTYQPAPPSAEVLARRAQMAAAKAQAIATGRSVLVGA
jgi:hypothetical protein